MDGSGTHPCRRRSTHGQFLHRGRFMFPFRCRILFSSFSFIYVFRLSYLSSFVASLFLPGLFRFELLYGIFVVGYGSTPILLLISFSFFFSFLPSFSRLSFCLLATPIPRTASPSLPPISCRCSPFLIIIFSPTLYLLCVLYTCCSGLLSIPRSFPLDGYIFSACEQTLSVHFPTTHDLASVST